MSPKENRMKPLSIIVLVLLFAGGLFFTGCESGPPPDPEKVKEERKELSNKRQFVLNASKGKLLEVKKYLNLGGDVNVQVEEGWTALMAASAMGHERVVERLLLAGADPDLQNQTGATALMYAVSGEHTEVVKMLVEAGADVGIRTNSEATAQSIAMDKDLEEIQNILTESETALSLDRVVKDPDFRNVKWGMTKEEVKEIEGQGIQQLSSDKLSYPDSIAGFKAMVTYYFNESGLYRGRYYFLQKHDDKIKYIDDFDKLKELLVTKYGPPGADEIEWKNSTYKAQVENYDKALLEGHLQLYTQWITERTNIRLSLKGEEGEIILAIDYRAVGTEESGKEITEEELEGL